MTKRQTREQLGLPPDGLEKEGIAVIRGHDRLVVYHDIDRRPLIRFGQDDGSAELLLSTLHQDIRKNPPVPKHIQKIGSQVRQHSPMLIRDGTMLWHHGAENTGCKPVLDRLPDTPTIGLCAVYMPTRSRRNERVADCPGDQVGGVFETVHLINGVESHRSERWDDCVSRPPVEASRFRWETHPERTNCHRAMRDVSLGIIARRGIHDFRISGEYREERKKWTYTETFPKEWSLPPLVLTWTDPWIVKRDTCQATWNTRGSESGSRKIDRCTQETRRDLTWRWRQGRTSARMQNNPHVRRGAWRDVGALDCPPTQRWTTSKTETGSYGVGRCKQARRRTATSHWRLLGTPWSKKEVQRVTYSAWRDVGGLDCPWDYWSTSSTETGSHKVNGCTQRRQRTVTSHWRQSARPGSAKQLRYKTHGSWRDVGQPNCPDRWTTWTTSENQSRNQRVNDCTQSQKRTVTTHWRQKVDAGGARIGGRVIVRTTRSPWRNDGKPVCGPKLSTTETVETRTVPAGQCKQRQQRKVVRRWLTFPVDSRFPSLSGKRIPASQRPVTHHPWRDVGKPYDCPKPVASTTVSTQTRSSCHQTTQESRHTSAEYRLFVDTRQVTHSWLTYPDGRRERGKPPFTYGPWQRERQTYSCRPDSGGGGNYGGGESAATGRGYDTDGDGVTDSTNPSGGHYGYSDRGVGAEASGGWSGGSFGVGSWSGSSDLGGGGWSGGFGSGSRGRGGDDRGGVGWGSNSGESESGGSDPWGGLR